MNRLNIKENANTEFSADTSMRDMMNVFHPITESKHEESKITISD